MSDTESQLLPSESLLSVVLDNMATAICLTDERGHCLYLNAAAERLLGYGLTEIRDRSLHDVVHHTRRDGARYPIEACPIEQALAKNERISGEETFVRQDGQFYPVAFTATPVRDKSRDIIGTIIELRDIAAEKSTNETRELIVREINHRAKNVLAVAQGIVRLTQGKDIAEYQAGVAGRIGALARAHTLLGRERWDGASLSDVVQDEVRAQPRPEAFRVEGPAVLLTANAVQPVGLILHELATNAAKYGALSAAHGRVNLSWCTKPDGGLELTWQESGGPKVMPPARSGFGSRLLRQLASQLGGDVALEWGPKGLVVRLSLSAKAYTSADSTSATERKLESARAFPVEKVRKGRVLVLEDNATIGLSMRDLLAAAGLEVLGPAMNLDEAIGHVLNSKFDAAFLDIELYGHPSFEVADALAVKGIPFVFCTGHAELVRRSRHQDRKVLRKPVTDDEVLAAFDEMIVRNTPRGVTQGTYPFLGRE